MREISQSHRDDGEQGMRGVLVGDQRRRRHRAWERLTAGVEVLVGVLVIGFGVAAGSAVLLSLVVQVLR